MNDSNNETRKNGLKTFSDKSYTKKKIELMKWVLEWISYMKGAHAKSAEYKFPYEYM